MGHCGTLDPFASGLLVILVGRATRLARFLVGLPKRYTGTIALGTTTDTDDRTGEVQSSTDSWDAVTDDALAAAAASLTGEYDQRPPTFSAKKVLGIPAHRLARAGTAPQLAATAVEVMDFQPGARTGRYVSFEAHVGSGTYIRALARDLGARLGCGGHLHTLRRTAVGPFRVSDALPLSALSGSAAALRAPLEAIPHLPRIGLDREAREKVAHGQPLPVPALADGHVALVHDDVLIAVAEQREGVLKPRVVLI